MKAFTVGAGIGGTLSLIGFFTLPWYHDYLVWGWTHPITWVAGIPAGIALALITE